MNKNKSLMYDIVVDMSYPDDEFMGCPTHLLVYHKLELELKSFLADYKGLCFINLGVGGFKIRELEQLVETHYYLVICGDKLEFVENELDYYFSNCFIPKSFKKTHMGAYHFDEENDN